MTESHESTRRLAASRTRPWLTLALCLAIFISGSVVGAGLSVLCRMEEWPKPAKTRDQRADDLAGKISNKLKLSPKDYPAVRQAVYDRFGAIEEIRNEEWLPTMITQAVILHDDVARSLPADKQAAWEDLFGQLYQKWCSQPWTGSPAATSAPADPSPGS